MGLLGEQEKTDTISVKSYFTTMLIGTLPIIGDIMLLKWAKSTQVRINKQNLCKAYFKLKLVLLYPILVLFLGIIVMIGSVA